MFDRQGTKPSPGAPAKQTEAWGWIQKVIPKQIRESNQVKPKHCSSVRDEYRVWKLKSKSQELSKLKRQSKKQETISELMPAG